MEQGYAVRCERQPRGAKLFRMGYGKTELVPALAANWGGEKRHRSRPGSRRRRGRAWHGDEAEPSAAFEMAKAEFLFEFLIVAFHDPPMFAQTHH